MKLSIVKVTDGVWQSLKLNFGGGCETEMNSNPVSEEMEENTSPPLDIWKHEENEVEDDDLLEEYDSSEEDSPRGW